MSRRVCRGRWGLPTVMGLLAALLLSLAPAATPAAAQTTVVVDNGSAGFSSDSAWTLSTGVAGAYNGDYRHDGGSGAEPGRWARWRPTIAASGWYQVFIRWAAHTNRP